MRYCTEKRVLLSIEGTLAHIVRCEKGKWHLGIVLLEVLQGIVGRSGVF